MDLLSIRDVLTGAQLDLILDFWTCDRVAMPAQFMGDAPGLRPHFYERPALKFGASPGCY